MNGKWLLILGLIICMGHRSNGCQNRIYFYKILENNIQSQVIEKIEFINSEKKDTLILNLKRDYLCKIDAVDSSITFTITNQKKFSIIKHLKCSQINMYIKGDQYAVKPQSFFSSGTPMSEYFFMTGNFGYILLYPGRIFYVDKKESFFKASFMKRVIQPVYKLYLKKDTL
jgi:hypothetical protein